MAEKTETTPTPTAEEAGVTTEKPVSTEVKGAAPGDDALWNKFFGGETEGDEEKPEKKTAKKPEKAEAKAPKKEETKPEKAAPKADAKSADKSTEDDDSEDEESEKKAAKDPKELFSKAKKSKDPREARKLYREAMKEAFGEIPDEFNDARFYASRKKAESEDKARETKATELAAKEANFDGRVKQAVAQLQPAVEVMRVLKRIEQGDWTQLGELVAKASGKSPEEALKLFTRGVRETPESRAASEARKFAEQTKREADERIRALEAKLEEKDQKRSEQERSQRLEAKKAAYLQEIEGELADHPVASIHNGFKRVMTYIIKTADPKLKAPRYTFEQAADRVVASERLRVRKAKHLLEDDTDESPAKPNAATSIAVARSKTSEGGKTPSTDPMASFDRIWSKHAKTGRRR